jgi:tRNA pseudouridine55 synthase
MKKVIILNKKEGETPLQALDNFRAKNKEYTDVKMTYAGRLDPMASGLLLVLTGEETKNREKYLALDKEYEFEILFGFGTDSYDILGKVISNKKELLVEQDSKEFAEIIKLNIKSFLGEYVQKYPMYSSKTVKGKPLFAYARADEEVTIPERKIFVKKLKLEKIRGIDNKKLFQNMEKRIKKVNGDFRQKEIVDIWGKELLPRDKNKEKFLIASFKIKCSSGTYVRGIANSLGELVGIPASAFSIKRTRVGGYVL